VTNWCNWWCVGPVNVSHQYCFCITKKSSRASKIRNIDWLLQNVGNLFRKRSHDKCTLKHLKPWLKQLHVSRAVSAALHTPQLGWGPRCHRGPKIPVPSPLRTQKNGSIPQIETYESLEISEVRGFLKEKCITVTLGAFESKVAHLYIAIAVGSHWKTR